MGERPAVLSLCLWHHVLVTGVQVMEESGNLVSHHKLRENLVIRTLVQSECKDLVI